MSLKPNLLVLKLQSPVYLIVLILRMDIFAECLPGSNLYEKRYD